MKLKLTEELMKMWTIFNSKYPKKKRNFSFFRK